VYPCDGPEIADGYDGVGVKFTAIITDARGRPQHPWSRTVKVPTGGPHDLGSLDPAQPFTPEEWKDIEDLAGPIRDAAEQAAQEAGQAAGSAAGAQSAAEQAAEDAQQAMQAQFLTQDEGVAALIETSAGPRT